MGLFDFVGDKIKQLRTMQGEGGLSQEALAKALGISTNTVSRWETATYRPSLDDLENLARFFKVSILSFFPSEEKGETPEISALLRAARELKPKDVKEVQRYAEYCRARAMYPKGNAPRPGRKRTGENQ